MENLQKPQEKEEKENNKIIGHRGPVDGGSPFSDDFDEKKNRHEELEEEER